MNRIPLSASLLDRLRTSLAQLPLDRVLDGSGPAGDGHAPGWIQGLSNTLLFDRHPRTDHIRVDHLSIFPAVTDAIHELMARVGYLGRHPMTQVLVNELASKGHLAPHRDGAPDRFRWHLPVTTNKDVTWWDEVEGQVHMEAGSWYGPVHYCGYLHSVTNDGDTARLHVVADFMKPNV